MKKAEVVRKFVMIFYFYLWGYWRVLHQLTKKRKTSDKQEKAKQTSKTTDVQVVDISSDEELEEVDSLDKKKQGPTSSTREFFNKPAPVLIKSEPRWSFACKLCKRFSQMFCIGNKLID